MYELVIKTDKDYSVNHNQTNNRERKRERERDAYIISACVKS